MELERFLELDESGLRAFIERRLRLLERVADQLGEVEEEAGKRVRERREALVEYGKDLGPYAYHLDSIEGLRLFALAAELECLDHHDELRGFAETQDDIRGQPETPERDDGEPDAA